MKILGIGNALVDILVKLENDYIIKELGFPAGSMQLVEKEKSNEIIKMLSGYETTQIAGGSAANTINGIARLGIETGFIGKVGQDSFGEFFANDFKKGNINNHLFISSTETGKAVAFISPDGERTFATYLGAAIEMTANDLIANDFEQIFSQYDLVHIEGYLVQNHDLLLKALELSKRYGLVISLDLASFNVVEQNLGFLHYITEKYIDIIFANEEEAKSFTGFEPEKALEEISKKCPISIVKIGKKGSLINFRGEICKIDVIKANPIDTTGAGDLYAAGFLYGIATQKTPEQCGKLGSLLSGNVIENLGAKIPEEKWQVIKELIRKI